MPRDARFWRNVTIIAVAHIAVVIALVRWNYEKGRPRLQSIVWLSSEAAARTEPAIEAAAPLRSRHGSRRTAGTRGPACSGIGEKRYSTPHRHALAISGDDTASEAEPHPAAEAVG